jgi:hypothetical protein
MLIRWYAAIPGGGFRHPTFPRESLQLGGWETYPNSDVDWHHGSGVQPSCLGVPQRELVAGTPSRPANQSDEPTCDITHTTLLLSRFKDIIWVVFMPDCPKPRSAKQMEAPVPTPNLEPPRADMERYTTVLSARLPYLVQINETVDTPWLMSIITCYFAFVVVNRRACPAPMKYEVEQTNRNARPRMLIIACPSLAVPHSAARGGQMLHGSLQAGDTGCSGHT